MKKALWCLLLLVSPLAMAELNVVTSFSILGDVTRNIGQDRVNVSVVVEGDRDVHTFQPTPGDARKFAAADLVLINGLGLEGWMPRMINASGYKKKVISIADNLPGLIEAKDDHDDHGHQHGHYDPHVWQDPVLMKSYVQNIAAALSGADPAGKAVYANNAKAYIAKLDALNAWAEKALSVIPQPKRRVITSHDAFSYLAQRYKIQFMAPQGANTESEASARDVAQLVRQVRQTGVRALFVENISDPRLMETLAKEAKVTLGGKLYSDALSKTPPANTYLGMYRYNIETLLAGMRRN